MWDILIAADSSDSKVLFSSLQKFLFAIEGLINREANDYKTLFAEFKPFYLNRLKNGSKINIANT